MHDQSAAQLTECSLSGPDLQPVLLVAEMWKAFENSTRRHAPRAAILYDKFHIMRQLGDALDQVHKHEHH